MDSERTDGQWYTIIRPFLDGRIKLYFDPYILFLVMFLNISKISNDQFVQDTLRNNYAYFNKILLYDFREKKDLQTCSCEKQPQKMFQGSQLLHQVINNFGNIGIGLPSDGKH